MPMTSGRRTMLTFGVPLALAFIGYGAFGIVNSIGLTHYSSTLTLHPVTQVLTVSASDGSVRIQVSPDADVHVLEKGVYSLSKPRLVAEVTPQGVSVRGRQCDGGILICSQDLVIEVPASFQVTANSSGGDVHAVGQFDNLDLSSSGGDVGADGATGRLQLQSGGGDVDGRNLQSPDVTASSSGGDVDLRFAVDPDQVEASSSGGDVDVQVPGDVPYRVVVKSSGGSATSTVRQDSSATHTINADSSGGDVSVRTPRSSS